MQNKFLLSAILTAMTLSASAAWAANFPILEDHDKYVKDLVSGINWGNGQPFIDSAYSNASNYKDYTVETKLTGKQKEQLKEGGAKYFFKKDHRIRVEVTKGSINQGSVVVRREDGVIRGCGGGMLKFMKLTLEEDSRMLQLPSGNSLMKADMATLLNEVRTHLKKGAKCKLSNDTISGKYWKGPVKVVEVIDGVDTITDRIFVNPKTSIPEEWDVYHDGGLVSITMFENFQPNTGLQDSLFDI